MKLQIVQLLNNLLFMASMFHLQLENEVSLFNLKIIDLLHSESHKNNVSVHAGARVCGYIEKVHNHVVLELMVLQLW